MGNDVKIGDTFTRADTGAVAWEVTSVFESLPEQYGLRSSDGTALATAERLLDAAGPWRRCEAQAVVMGRGSVGAPETPEQVAAPRCPRASKRVLDLVMDAIRADREQIAAWCEAKAAEAQREADAHGRMVTGEHGRELSDVSHSERAMYCEGQASAIRAIAAILKGSAT